MSTENSALPIRRDIAEEPSWYYRHLRRRDLWRGPTYRSSRIWRHDLLAVLNELEGLVRVNAPLARGLEAAATERRRIALTPPVLFLASAIVILLIIGLSVTNIGFAGSMPVAVGASIVIVAGIILLRSWLMRHQRLETILLVMADRLESGEQVSDVLASLNRVFPPYAIDIVRAGENSGRMLESLQGVRTRVVVRAGLHESLMFAFFYGLLLCVLISLILGFLMVKVLPVFLEIHEEFGGSGTLPKSSWQLMHFGDFIASLPLIDVIANNRPNFQGGFRSQRNYLDEWWPLLLGPLLAPVLYLVFRGPVGALAWLGGLVEWFLMQVPFLRRSVGQSLLAPAADMLSMLIKAGMPLPEALIHLEKSRLAGRYRRLFARVRKRVEQGDTFSDALHPERRQLPASFREMIALGEKSNMLPAALEHLSDTYTQNTATRYRILGEMMVPIVVVLLGIFVFWIELGMYQSIWSISDAIIDSM